MNPLKRKKLYRLELSKQKNKTEVQQVVEVKPTEVLVVKEEIKEETSVVQEQQATLEVSNVELALKPIETVEVTEAKKEKKKKWSSQDA
jgi:hypothetical protein